jgi:hypothetical protein
MTASPPDASPGQLPVPGDRQRILADSAPWLGALLNLLPGLGTGYIYQRRWRAWWITSAVATAWFVLGAFLAGDTDRATATATAPDPDPEQQLIGLAGLLLLAAVTTVEAFLAARKARMY